MLGHEGLLVNATWQEFDPELAKEEEIEIVVQVNGRIRAKFSAPEDISPDELEKRALEDEKILAHLEGKTVRKVIVVPKKLVNVVVH